MDKKLKISLWTTIIIIFTLLVLQIIMLKEVYLHEKHIYCEKVNEIIEFAVDNNNRYQAYSPPHNRNIFSYNYKTKTVIVIINSVQHKFPIDDKAMEAAIFRQAYYDIRDKKLWTMENLIRSLKEEMEKQNTYFPYSFTLRDSTGTILEEIPGNIPELQVIHARDIKLGFVEKHILSTQFSYDFNLFIRSAWDRIIIALGLGIALIFSVSQLFLRYWNEKQSWINRENFTHALVHNLRAPVTIAKKEIEVMQMEWETELSETQEAAFTEAYKQFDKVLREVTNLLTLSVNAYGLKIKRHQTHIRNIIEELKNQYELLSDTEKEINIELHIDKNVHTIVADSDHIHGVLSNLLDNAIKYSRKSVKIIIICYLEKKNMILSVKDNGIGIAPEDLPYIFKMRRRSARGRMKNQPKGYGIGLFYVKEVINAHRGNVTVNSDGHSGSEFIITIPHHSKKQYGNY